MIRTFEHFEFIHSINKVLKTKKKNLPSFKQKYKLFADHQDIKKRSM